MSKSSRVSRPKNELKRELVEQLQILRNSCQTFDSGFEAIGRHIALSLRVLLHHKNNSKSLIEQLGLRSGRFFDSTEPLNENNLLGCNLITYSVGDTGGRYLPCIHFGNAHFPNRAIPFINWWNDPILKDKFGRTFSRRDLVEKVANTDGGAHVDPKLDEAYMAISRSNSLGFEFVSGNSIDAIMKAQGNAFEGRPELACMRQIAHELLYTVRYYAPEFSEHAKPVIPSVNTTGLIIKSCFLK